MGPIGRIALVTAALAAAVSVAPPAALGFPENGGTETATVETPADGYGVATTDELPAKATQAEVTVTPLTDQQFFSRLSVALTNSLFFDFADRVGACVFVTEQVVKNPDFFPGYTIPKDKTLQILFLAACLQTALEVSLQQGNARDAAAACLQTPLFMSVRYKRRPGGYGAKVTPTAKRFRLRPKYRVSCRRTAKGLQLKIVPRKRGQRLRSAVGPTLGLGVVNPSGRPIRLRIAFTAR